LHYCLSHCLGHPPLLAALIHVHPLMSEEGKGLQEATLLDAFRLYHQKLESAIIDITSSSSGADSVIVERLGDDIDEFTALFNQVSWHFH